MRRNSLGLVCLAAACGAFAACGHKKRPVTSPLPPTPVRTAPYPVTETGIASWYGHPYHGRPAANGEVYDMEQPTAAHRTLPFGTFVRVTNLTNGKSTDVRITDRGPFIAGRIIDLSHYSAGQIGLIAPGTAPVRIDVLSPPTPVLGAPPTLRIEAGPAFYAVQVGAFQERATAEAMRERMLQTYGTAQIVLRQGTPPMWRVLVGREPSQDSANQLGDKLKREVGPGFIVRLDDNLY